MNPGVAGPVYPDDAFSRPRVDRSRAFTTLAGCSQAMDVVSRDAHYERNELLLVDDDGRGRVRWSLKPRDMTSAALNIQERIRREPTAVAFRVRNEGPRPIRFSLLAPEAPWWPVAENVGLTWVLGEPQEVAPGAEAELTFPWASRRVMTPGDHTEPRFPMNALVLQSEGYEAGTEHELVLSDLAIHYPTAEGARVAAIECPSSARAGEQIGVRVAATVPPTARVADIEFRREPWVLWRRRLTERELTVLRAEGTLALQVTLGGHLGDEELTVGLVLDGYRVEGAEARTRVRGGPAHELPRVERREHHGRPACFVEGEPFPWWGYSSYDFQPGNATGFGRHGVNAFCIPLACGGHVYATCEFPNQIAPEEWDFGQLEERVGFCLQANPDARLTLRLSLAMPPCWAQEHASEMALIEVDGKRIAWEEASAYRAPSIASEVWQDAQEEALRHVLRYCRSRPWAGRLLAIWLTCEVTEEWFAWGCNDGRLADYSPANQRGFARWLGERGLPGADEAEPIPSAMERSPEGIDLLPDTPVGRRVAAYQQYYGDLHAEVVGRFARVVKEETAGRTLVGAFLGYVIELAGESRQSTAGHMPLRELLADPNVDFLAGIPLLDYRTFPEGYMGPVTAMESVHASGKLYCVENDLFSWLHPLIWHWPYYAEDPRAGAIAMHERVLGYDVVHGCLAQKFSLMCSWHHDGLLQRAFARHQRVYARTVAALDRTPVEQIALVIDDTSFAWLPAASVQARHSNKELLRALGQTGAASGVWLASDLDRLPQRVRLVVLAMAPAPRPEDLEKLRLLLEAGGRTIVVVGPVGLVDPVSQRWQPEVTRELLGLPLRFVPEGGMGGAVLHESGEWVCGNDGSLRPRFEAEAQGLLRTPDGKPASAERALPNGGRLIWCSVPPSHVPLLREWALEAGVHCYAPEGYVVHAARGIVSLTAPRAEEATLHWPGEVRARDLLGEWEAQGRETRCPFAAGQTRLLEVEWLG